jgi:hypothetical protein
MLSKSCCASALENHEKTFPPSQHTLLASIDAMEALITAQRKSAAIDGRAHLVTSASLSSCVLFKASSCVRSSCALSAAFADGSLNHAPAAGVPRQVLQQHAQQHREVRGGSGGGGALIAIAAGALRHGGACQLVR